MRAVSLKDGYLICPAAWIILNPKDAPKHCYAGVIEGKNVLPDFPHFIWFTDCDYHTSFTDDELSAVRALCVKAYPAFSSIYAQQVELIESSTTPGKFLNLSDWERAPHIEAFHIFVQGETYDAIHSSPPYGTKIIRNPTEMEKRKR